MGWLILAVAVATLIIVRALSVLISWEKEVVNRLAGIFSAIQSITEAQVRPGQESISAQSTEKQQKVLSNLRLRGGLDNQIHSYSSLTEKTKLEAVLARTGTVIVIGFSNIGSISSPRWEIKSIELIDSSNGEKKYGIAIMGMPADGGEREQSGALYIDYEEIESLLNGIDYIVLHSRLKGMGSSVAKLEAVQNAYRTKGGILIETLSLPVGETIWASVRGVGIEASTCFPLFQLAELRELIAGAKKALDAIK